MFNLIVGFFVLLMWFIALVLIILTIVFRKRKVGRWILGGLAAVFASIPFLLFWGFERNKLEQQEQFVGQYKSDSSLHFLNLNEDLTWSSDTNLFDCPKGTWEFVITEDMSYLELKGNCEKDRMFLQIYDCNKDHLSFTPDQNTGNTKPRVDLERN